MLKPRPAPETKQRQPAHVGLLRTIPTYRPVTSHEIPARRAAIRVVPGLPRRTADDDTTTTTRDSKPPRARSRVPSRARAVWAKGMAGLWCSSQVASRSRRVSRREAQGRIKTQATQPPDGLCVCVRDAPRGTGSILSGSMIVLSIPRRLRGPTRAGSMRSVNNNSWQSFNWTRSTTTVTRCQSAVF